MSKRSSYTKARIRRGRGSTQFAEGEIVYVRMSRDGLRSAINDVHEDPDDRPMKIWIMEDPETERGAYGFIADLELA